MNGTVPSTYHLGRLQWVVPRVTKSADKCGVYIALVNVRGQGAANRGPVVKKKRSFTDDDIYHSMNLFCHVAVLPHVTGFG